MATELDAARLLVFSAARLADAGRPYTREAAMAKLFASEAASRAAAHGVQIHGGSASPRVPGRAHLPRRQALTIGEGTSEIHAW